ncbi:MAG: exostosin domain-containing protein [Chloroflexota bacterium]|nr:MAG: hypothetical protein DLM70_11855 [Chloroflexota bacterium]
MKIFCYARPSSPRIPRTDFSLSISEHPFATSTAWDDVHPADADYILVPVTFRVEIPGLHSIQHYNGGDIMVPFVFRGQRSGEPELRNDLREAIVRAFLNNFPHYEKYPEKHVFIDNGDLGTPCPPLCGSILFQTNPSYQHSSVLTLPQNVPDPGPPRPIAEAQIDVSFQGHLDQHPIRKALGSWSTRETELTVEFRPSGSSIFMVDGATRFDMVRTGFELMRRSRFVLSPRGRGTGSRRLYEILAHGRIPILISDAYKLPLEGVINWERFLVRVPEGFTGLTASYVFEFLHQHDLKEASELARRTYLEYFAPPSFRRFLELSLATRKQ